MAPTLENPILGKLEDFSANGVSVIFHRVLTLRTIFKKNEEWTPSSLSFLIPGSPKDEPSISIPPSSKRGPSHHQGRSWGRLWTGRIKEIEIWSYLLTKSYLRHDEGEFEPAL